MSTRFFGQTGSGNSDFAACDFIPSDAFFGGITITPSEDGRGWTVADSADGLEECATYAEALRTYADFIDTFADEIGEAAHLEMAWALAEAEAVA